MPLQAEELESKCLHAHLAAPGCTYHAHLEVMLSECNTISPRPQISSQALRMALQGRAAACTPRITAQRHHQL